MRIARRAPATTRRAPCVQTRGTATPAIGAIPGPALLPARAASTAVQPANLLTIRVGGAAGSLPKGLNLGLETKGWKLFDSHHWGPSAVHRVIGCPPVTYTSGDGHGGAWTHFGLPDDGVVKLRSVMPDVELLVTVLDRVGGVLVSQKLRTPGVGVKRAVDITVTGALRDLALRVRDAAGAPLANATVSIGENLRRTRATTDREGRVLFKGVYSREAVVVVQHPGHSMHIDLHCDLTGPLLELELPEARMLTVTFVDELDKPVAPNCDLRIKGLYLPLRGVRVKSGVYEFAGVPKGLVDLRYEIGGRSRYLRHDTSLTKLRVIVKKIEARSKR